MIPTDREISYFLETYSERHLTRAALRLKISQPALTQSIVRLERKLKTKLFVRTKRGCQPTEAGDLLFEKANRLRECWGEIESSVFDSRETLRGRFRLGCHPSVGAYTLPAFFKTVDRVAPRLEIRLVHGFSREITEKIVRFELDFGFVINPVRHPDLVLVKLGTDRIRFWKSRRSKRVPKIVFSDLSDHELKNRFGEKALRPVSEWKKVETESLELIRTLTIQGAGIGFLPERVAAADRADLEKVESLPTLSDEIYLAYRVDALRSVSGKTIVSAAKECLLG